MREVPLIPTLLDFQATGNILDGNEAWAATTSVCGNGSRQASRGVACYFDQREQGPPDRFGQDW